ncbi:MAG: mechanosensitive ion channel domain-containing protein [Paracoccus sp. (in: a-proteobacteria)]
MTKRSLTAFLAVGLLAITQLLVPHPLRAAESSDSSAPNTATVQPNDTISLTTDAGTDAAIQKQIESIMANLKGYENVTVAVDDGMVTMEGAVLTRASQEHLEKLIARIDGVAEVQDNIKQNTDLQKRFHAIREHFLDRFVHILGFIPLITIALITAMIIIWLGNRVARMHRLIDRVAPNPFIAEILSATIRIGFWITAVVVALDTQAAAGIMGIAIGFAVRDSVENFIASVLLSLRQPFRPNDLVEIEGNSGHVLQLTSRATTLLSHDGNHIRIPNATSSRRSSPISWL